MGTMSQNSNAEFCVEFTPTVIKFYKLFPKAPEVPDLQVTLEVGSCVISGEWFVKGMVVIKVSYTNQNDENTRVRATGNGKR